MGDGRKNPTNSTEQRERDLRNVALNALRHKLSAKKQSCAGGCAINGPVVFQTGQCINCEADAVMRLSLAGTACVEDVRAYVRGAYRDPPLEYVAAMACLAAGCNNPTLGGGNYCVAHSPQRLGLAPQSSIYAADGSYVGRTLAGGSLAEKFPFGTPERPNLNAIYGKLGAPDEDWYYPEGSWIPIRRPKLISRATFAEVGEIADLREKLSTAQTALTKYMKERAPLADEATMLRAENKTLSAECHTLRRKLEDAERKLASRGKR